MVIIQKQTNEHKSKYKQGDFDKAIANANSRVCVTNE